MSCFRRLLTYGGDFINGRTWILVVERNIVTCRTQVEFWAVVAGHLYGCMCLPVSNLRALRSLNWAAQRTFGGGDFFQNPYSPGRFIPFMVRFHGSKSRKPLLGVHFHVWFTDCTTRDKTQVSNATRDLGVVSGD